MKVNINEMCKLISRYSDNLLGKQYTIEEIMNEYVIKKWRGEFCILYEYYQDARIQEAAIDKPETFYEVMKDVFTERGVFEERFDKTWNKR
jgi:hypothetical protein